MRGIMEERAAQASAIERQLRLCIPPFGRACKGMWPHKTAEELAAIAGCTVRAAAYQISGESEPSAKAIYAIYGLWLGKGER